MLRAQNSGLKKSFVNRDIKEFKLLAQRRQDTETGDRETVKRLSWNIYSTKTTLRKCSDKDECENATLMRWAVSNNSYVSFYIEVNLSWTYIIHTHNVVMQMGFSVLNCGYFSLTSTYYWIDIILCSDEFFS